MPTSSTRNSLSAPVVGRQAHDAAPAEGEDPAALLERLRRASVRRWTAEQAPEVRDAKRPPVSGPRTRKCMGAPHAERPPPVIMPTV